MDYKNAGVNIQRSDEVKKEIARLVRLTYNKDVLAGVGSFGAMYDSGPFVLVASIDGAGTKIVIAKEMNSLEVIGRDLVNHSINDILCQGATTPLFFMDYIAQGKLDGQEIEDLITGMVFSCKEAGIIALIGGETAQMPGIYKEGMLDTVGVIIGKVERNKIIDGSKIKPGDMIIGLPSSGPHTNGYSLIRKIFSEKLGWSPYFWSFWIEELGGRLGKALLKPHRSYLQSVSLLLNQFEIHGIAHITGGGLAGNIVRVLPEGCQAQIRLGSWPVLPIFRYIQKEGRVSNEEMYQVFNMGIGMVLIVSREISTEIYKFLWDNNELCYFIGEIFAGEKEVIFLSRKFQMCCV